MDTTVNPLQIGKDLQWRLIGYHVKAIRVRIIEVGRLLGQKRKHDLNISALRIPHHPQCVVLIDVNISCVVAKSAIGEPQDQVVRQNKRASTRTRFLDLCSIASGQPSDLGR